jgi:hypothetical protein
METPTLPPASQPALKYFLLRPLLGPTTRVAAVLALCAACYQIGRWTRGLEVSAEPPTIVMIVPHPIKSDGRVDPSAGESLGTSEDTITPLNVRDPTNLIMGPARIEDAKSSSESDKETDTVPSLPRQRLPPMKKQNSPLVQEPKPQLRF